MGTEATAEERYSALADIRQNFLDEAQWNASLTIPALFPDNQDARHTLTSPRSVQEMPHQSLGARGVRSLASKLLLTLLPTNSSLIRYELDPDVVRELDEAGRADARSDLQQVLARRESSIMLEIDAQGYRVKVHRALMHLLVAGNILLYTPPSGGMRVFPLNQYVVRRDFIGNLIEIVYVEVLDRATLPVDIKEALEAAGKLGSSEEDRRKAVRLYTHVIRKDDNYEFHQEAEGVVIPGKNGTVAIEASPWMVLRFQAVDGDDYSPSYVSEFRGDLKSLDDLRHAITLAASNAAKLVLLVNPNAQISVRQLQDSVSGEVLPGRPDDVFFLQQGKNADMSVAKLEEDTLDRAISADFLLNSSFQRAGERVTAEEIRRMAEDLENTLGGFYSVLAQELQKPLALRVEAQLVSDNKIEKLPKGVVSVPSHSSDVIVSLISKLAPSALKAEEGAPVWLACINLSKD